MTLILVISDIHKDDRALRSALENLTYEKVWCLGDVAGHANYVRDNYDDYDGDIRASYQLLRDKGASCIKGNWECWLLNPEKDDDPDAFQYKYRDELISDRAALAKTDMIEWIRNEWKTIIEFPEEKFTLVHGNIFGRPGTEACEDYLYPELTREINRIRRNVDRHMLFGHTHIPGYFKANGVGIPIWKSLTPQAMDEDIKYNLDHHNIQFFINPGSINQQQSIDRRKVDRVDFPGTVIIINTDDETFRYVPINVGV